MSTRLQRYLQARTLESREPQGGTASVATRCPSLQKNGRRVGFTLAVVRNRANLDVAESGL